VRKNHAEALIFREAALNRLGYQYLNSRKIEDALGIFKLNILGPSDLFTKEGFIFVYQDVHDKFKFEGDFIVMRPYLPDKLGPQDTDESSDFYDAIEWLLENIPNHNGRRGVEWLLWQDGLRPKIFTVP
jgi:predicted acyl esterase